MKNKKYGGTRAVCPTQLKSFWRKWHRTCEISAVHTFFLLIVYEYAVCGNGSVSHCKARDGVGVALFLLFALRGQVERGSPFHPAGRRRRPWLLLATSRESTQSLIIFGLLCTTHADRIKKQGVNHGQAHKAAVKPRCCRWPSASTTGPYAYDAQLRDMNRTTSYWRVTQGKAPSGFNQANTGKPTATYSF